MSKEKKQSRTVFYRGIKPIEDVIKDIQNTSEDATKLDTNEADYQETQHLQQKRYQELRKITAEADKIEQDNEGRRVLKDSIFAVTVVWMFLILVIVWHTGTGSLRLSDTVLVALITTTTANVFAFLYVVVNYLYNKEKST